MLKHVKLLLKIVAVNFLFTQQAQADIIFEQGFTGTSPQSVSGTGNASQSELNTSGPTPPTATDHSIETADQFTVVSNTNLTTVRWAGEYNNQSAMQDNFRIRIYADNGSGKPDSNNIIHELNIGDNIVREAPTDLKFFTNQLYSYEYTLTNPITLLAGTTYWISIANNINSNTWRWTSINSAPSSAAFRQGPDIDTVPWSDRVGTYQFQLDSTNLVETTTLIPIPTPSGTVVIPIE